MSKYETPEYAVIATEEPYEIRQYESFYIVEYENVNDPEINNGFGTLFRYISSENAEKKKINMTVPVIEEMTADGLKMAFVVPKEHWEKTPSPNNPNLSVKEFDHGLFAVIRYSGFSNTSKERIKLEMLESWIVRNGYKKVSNAMLAFYNAPFTPPMFRRNEIMIRVEAN
ncbi:MAG: heme-binding protein [Eubacteriales bacterium]|nr:heme-binding protein [Eubacteriales bacterium]